MGCGLAKNKERKESQVIANPNENEIPKPDIKVIYRLENGTQNDQVEHPFPPSCHVDILLQDADLRLKSMGRTVPHEYLYKDQNLLLSTGKEIKDVIATGETEMLIIVRQVGLSIPLKFLEEFEKLRYVARPLFDPFELVIFETQTHKVTVESFYVVDSRLNNFSVISAYCNGGNKLFVSGGDEMKNQFAINDLELKTTLFVEGMKNLRSWHSMIYVPGGFVFMVGGAETNNVEYYDLTKKEFVNHSTIINQRSEPSLALIDNTYIYAFGGYAANKTEVGAFERINLRTNSTVWEDIGVLTYENGLKSLPQLFFAVANLNQNEVIFLGGMDHEAKSMFCRKNYVFNFETKTIRASTHPAVEEEFSEKYFIPINEKSSLLFPNLDRTNLKILAFTDERIQAIKFEQEN